MDNEKIIEMLGQQFELLAKRSNGTLALDELIAISDAMCLVVRTITDTRAMASV